MLNGGLMNDHPTPLGGTRSTRFATPARAVRRQTRRPDQKQDSSSPSMVESCFRWERQVAVSTSAPPRCLDGGDVDLPHCHHRLESTLCLTATGRKRVG